MPLYQGFDPSQNLIQFMDFWLFCEPRYASILAVNLPFFSTLEGATIDFATSTFFNSLWP